MNSSTYQKIERLPKAYKSKPEEELSAILRRDNGIVDGNTALDLLLRSFRLPKELGQKAYDLFLENLKLIIFSIPNENELYTEKIFGVRSECEIRL